MHKDNNFSIFAGSSHNALAQAIAAKLEKSLGNIEIKKFHDGEIGVKLLENVRGKKVFVIQTIALDPNNYLMELLIIIDALKRAAAKEIVAVIPYYGYARQDRKDNPREPITAKLVADILEKAGVSQVVTMDLHAGQIQGFFNVPLDNLTARRVLVEKLQNIGFADKKKSIVVAPDVGSSKLARRFATDLGIDLAIIDKRRINEKTVEDYALIGEVENKDVIIVDDVFSTGVTLAEASKLCRKGGANKMVSVVTHGPILQDMLKDCVIDKFLFTDTIPHNVAENEKIEIVSIAKVFADAIDCILSKKSISSLFE
jgi:ribose-phosphate pyrophosphokinase